MADLMEYQMVVSKAVNSAVAMAVQWAAEMVGQMALPTVES
jgi:hypothetical protein